MPVVYRVMDAQGGGPYRGANSLGWWEHCDPEYHPSPNEDGVPYREGVLFGYVSKADARRWWAPAERETLHRNGFALYEVPAVEVLAGRRQCAFVPLGWRPQQTTWED